MSDYDKSKSSKKKFHPTRIKESSSHGRSFTSNKTESATSLNFIKESAKESFITDSSMKKQPTILLKTREHPAEEIAAFPKRGTHREEHVNISIASSSRDTEANAVPTLKSMVKSMKLIDDGVLCSDSLQDFVNDNNEFLIVGIVGAHGVGKSTVMNLLAHNQITEDIKKYIFKSNKSTEGRSGDIKILTEHLDKADLRSESKMKKEIFKIETVEDIENCYNRTQGIDIFITSNRLILLDCQPFASVSVLEELIKSESKRTNLVSEFIPLENSGEIQGLQLTAFLMSVCHVLILVQDWFFDSNVVRFIQTAEMLKPTIPNPEDELTDYFPHLLLVHNRAQIEDFSPSKFKTMQEVSKANAVPTLESMVKSMKLIDDGVLCSDSLQDFVNDNNEFLIVGIVGAHGVGKSTVMNLLAHNQITEDIKNYIFKSNKSTEGRSGDIKILTEHLDKAYLRSESKMKKEIFKIETVEDIENCYNRTQIFSDLGARC